MTGDNLTKRAFLDESGNEGLDLSKPQVSSHYIVTAVVLDTSSQESTFSALEDIKSRFFRDKEMKSSSRSVRSIERRAKVIGELSELLGSSVMALAVRKEGIKSVGFTYPKSFIKNIYARLIREIHRDHPGIEIEADEIKGKHFLREFKHYILSECQQTLFNPWKFDPVKSRLNVGVQAADLIGGSLAMLFNSETGPEARAAFSPFLRSMLAYFEFFPPRSGNELTADLVINNRNEYDVCIADRAIEDALLLQQVLDPDEEKHTRMFYALQCLIAHHELSDTERWLSTPDLLCHVNQYTYNGKLTERALRNVIGKLRNRGLLVASQQSGGYRLAICESDLYRYLDVQGTQILPMLNRIRGLRQTVKRATDGKLDILAYDKHADLRHAVEATDDFSS